MLSHTEENIDGIQFGILSDEDITNISVCEINSSKLSGNNTVYDNRLGVLNHKELCSSCSKNNNKCSGHFGHISLNIDILHPLFYKYVHMFLKCFCSNCSRCILSEEQLILNNIHNYSTSIKFNKIKELCEKTDICIHCSSMKHKIMFNSYDQVFYINHKSNNTKTILTDNEIKIIFDNIPIKDVKMLGINDKLFKPSSLIMTKLLVLPTVARPYVVVNNLTCDDDLTVQYVEIIKINNMLADNSIQETKRNKLIQALKFRIKSLFDNTQEKSKHSNGRPMKGIKKRISGKDGQIRNNLMGKRVDKSARTVIGPDPTLRLDEIAIPQKIANILTYPEYVNTYNIKQLSKLIETNKINFIIRNKQRINLTYARFRKGDELLYNDIIQKSDGTKIIIGHDTNKYKLNDTDVIIRNGKIKSDFVFPKQKNFKLQFGDIVERPLKDGDYVLLNRQPTLHRGSMLAQKIIVRPYKTFRMNLAITKTFNADFDGDEMNIHVPVSYESVTELKYIASSKYNMISPQSSKSNIAIVQDGLLGSYLLTKEDKPLTKDVFFQLLQNVDGLDSMDILGEINHIRKVIKDKLNKDIIYSTRMLFSFILPNNFYYTRKNKCLDHEPIVKICNGVLVEGAINKSIIGSSHNSIIQTLLKEKGEEIAINFINNVQFIACSYLLYQGFTISISDCIATKSSEINHVITKCFIEAKGNEEYIQDERIREIKVNASLSKARDNGMKIAKDALPISNNFISTVTSGSKGDFFNIAQITGLLGQQNLTGARIPYNLNNNTRSLPHYPMGKLSQEREYESKGFIKNSFIHGLNPYEFWFHSLTGREGITDTAMKTATSGYIQRRIIKLSEDIQIKYDGTVRNSNNNIIQFQYGDDNLDGAKTIILNGKPQICDLKRLIKSINNTLPVNISRKLTQTEIEYIMSDIKINNSIPFDIKYSIEKNLKNNLREQIDDSVLITNEESVNLIRKEIEFNYTNSQIQPGESVGVITGESIGERQTQMTLNTFHSAGLAINTVLTGVPRFSELLNATKDPKATTCNIFFNKKINSITELREIISNKIKQINFGDIVTTYSLFTKCEPEDWYDEYKILYDDLFTHYNLGIKFSINEDVLFENNICITDVVNIIQNYVDECIFTTDQIHVFINPSDEYSSIFFLNEIVYNELMNIKISGIENLTDVFFIQEKEKETWSITTNGSNLIELFKLDFIDKHNTVCNNMWEIFELFGIEAARQFLIDEFKNVVSSDGTYINDRHIKILVDVMTQHGVICSVSRYGMKKDKSGPLAKASFEQSLDNFIKAGIYCDKETMKGVSANIMCGNKTKIGTGMCELLQDFSSLPICT